MRVCKLLLPRFGTTTCACSSSMPNSTICNMVSFVRPKNRSSRSLSRICRVQAGQGSRWYNSRRSAETQIRYSRRLTQSKMKESCWTKFFRFLIRYVIGHCIIFPSTVLLSPFYRLHDAFQFLWFQNRNISSPHAHRLKVEAVQKQVRTWNSGTSSGGRKSTNPRRMCTARPARASISVHKLDKSNLAQIQLGALNSVVEIDEVAGSITVEPGLMMGQLTSILIPRGWTIPVVPEFDILSVGGLICGCGVESSSTRYGLMAKSALEFEVVLSSGELVTCSKDAHSDLFYAIPWSHGTIGLLTAVKFPLLPAKKYVKLEYHAADNVDEAQKLLESQDHMFVEGIMYGPQKFVVMHGDMSDGEETRKIPVRHLTRWYSPFFVSHVKGFLRQLRKGQKGSTSSPVVAVELIPLRDYYHRHTRPYFWTVPITAPITSNRLFLFLFGFTFPFADMRYVQRLVVPCLGPMTYRLYTIMMNMIQDFVVPMKDLRTFLEFTHIEMGAYPLWLCPCMEFNKPGMTHSSETGPEKELWIDIGVYGNASKEAMPRYDPVETLRKFEAFTMEKGGYQLTYAGTCLTRAEFRSMFDMRHYDEVRAKYDCLDAFPDVYDKVGKEERAFKPGQDV